MIIFFSEIRIFFRAKVMKIHDQIMINPEVFSCIIRSSWYLSSIIWWFPKSWGYPNTVAGWLWNVMEIHGKSHGTYLEMDDHWGYHGVPLWRLGKLWKAPHLVDPHGLFGRTSWLPWRCQTPLAPPASRSCSRASQRWPKRNASARPIETAARAAAGTAANGASAMDGGSQWKP